MIGYSNAIEDSQRAVARMIVVPLESWAEDGDDFVTIITDGRIPVDDDDVQIAVYVNWYDITSIKGLKIDTDTLAMGGGFILKSHKKKPKSDISGESIVFSVTRNNSQGIAMDISDYIDLRIASALDEARNNIDKQIADIEFVIQSIGIPINPYKAEPELLNNQSTALNIFDYLEDQIAAALNEITNYTTDKINEITPVIQSFGTTSKIMRSDTIMQDIDSDGNAELRTRVDEQIVAMNAAAKEYIDEQIAALNPIIQSFEGGI